jgi:hypothetical protein
MIQLKRPQKPAPTEDPRDWPTTFLDKLGLAMTLVGVVLILTVTWGPA